MEFLKIKISTVKYLKIELQLLRYRKNNLRPMFETELCRPESKFQTFEFRNVEFCFLILDLVSRNFSLGAFVACGKNAAVFSYVFLRHLKYF